jgi:hypothetical protein
MKTLFARSLFPMSRQSPQLSPNSESSLNNLDHTYLASQGREESMGSYQPIQELLLNEYQECNCAYAYRDQLTNECCRGIVQTFSVFLTILLATTFFIEVGRYIHIAFCVVIGIASLFSMGTMLLNLESTASCKIALRNRSIEIENTLNSMGGPKIWERIDNRSKFFEERLFKGQPGCEKGRVKDRLEPEYDMFTWAARLLIFLWLVVLIVVAIWGPKMETATFVP